MRNPTPILLGLAALSSTFLAGCGGAASPTGGTTSGSSLSVTGGAAMTAQTVVSEIPASGTPTTFNFGGTSANIPAGITIPAGASVAIVGTSSPVLGLQGTGAFSVNGGATGITLTNGSLSSSVALPPTTGAPYTIAATAPVGGFFIPGGRGIARDLTGLTINDRFELGVPVLTNGTAGFPTNLSGTVPTNGSNAANVSLTVTYPAAFASYHATLTISWTDGKSRVSINQTKTVSSAGTVTFTAKSAHAIPATGVDKISLVLTAPF